MSYHNNTPVKKAGEKAPAKNVAATLPQKTAVYLFWFNAAAMTPDME